MNVYVLGVATHPASLAEHALRLEELAYRTARAALDDARVSRGQLDHLTIGACDELDGRPISSMLMAAPAGGFMIDETKVTDSGAMALCLGMARILTGEFQLGLVSSWCKSSKTNVDDVMRFRSEPFYTRPIGIDMNLSHGLFAQATADAYGVSEDEATTRAVEALHRATCNPRGLRTPVPSVEQVEMSEFVATPVREAHCALPSDGAASLVLASERFLDRNPSVKPIARIAGIGWSVGSYRMDAAQLRSMSSFKGAWARALKMAEWDDAKVLDVVELESPTSWHEAAAVRALGLSDRGEVSPSGGTFAQNPQFCAGLVGVVEAVLQVAGRAGPVQRPNARRAASHSCHGFAQQGNVVACFEAVGKSS